MSLATSHALFLLAAEAGTKAEKVAEAGSTDGSSALIAYALVALCGIGLLAIVLMWTFGLPRRSRPREEGLDKIMVSSASAADVKANSELVLVLLRSVIPSNLSLYFESDQAEEPQIDLDRCLRVLRNSYEQDLKLAEADGNAYLALARNHVATAALIADVNRLCTWLHRLEQEAVTKEHVSVVATRTTITAVTLLCGFGGALLAALKFG